MTFRHKISSLGLWLAIALAVPLVAIAISERHFFEVEHENEAELLASLDIALGRVNVGKADDGYLFQAEVVLENDRIIPDFEYQVNGDRGRLDVDLSTVKDADDNVSLPDLESVKDAKWDLYFGDAVPIDLKLELGGTASTLDFSGIPLRTLRVKLEASQGSITFHESNPVEMDYMRIESGASELSISGLGYARAERMRFDGGMGKFALDFSENSEALRGTVVDIEIGVSSIDIRLPSDIPVLLDVPDSWFCSVDVPDGYVKAGHGEYHSPDYSPNREVFTVNVEASVGKVNFSTR
ncbi:toast rack family protein [Bacteroidota bacterium]